MIFYYYDGKNQKTIFLLNNMIDLSNYKTRYYLDKATPLQFLKNISNFLKNNIYIKRDDITYLCGGGNKSRKLEYLIQDALDNNSDTIITCGAVQSNHCRLTASAASLEGLDCYVVLEERIPGSYDKDASGNNYLFKLLGCKTSLIKSENSKEAMDEIYYKLIADGKKPYIIPGGGSCPLGILGYIDCAQEIIKYCEEHTKFDIIFCCSGSGGTHAGLLLGLRNYNIKIIGISTRLNKEKQTQRIKDKIIETEEFLGLEHTIDDIIVYDDYVGEGYSIPTYEMNNAIEKFARLEGILLDPVYTGKCAAGMIDICQKEDYLDKNILFIHTGGSPALYHYQPLFESL